MIKRNPEVELSFVEILSASTVGSTRRIKSMFTHKENKSIYGLWESDITVAIAECVFAKYLNRYWTGSPDSFGKPDSGDVQVRSSSREDGPLVLREADKENDKFVLVSGPAVKDKSALFTVRGWLLGKDGKVDAFVKHVKDRPSIWVIPQSDLNPMEG